MYSDKEKIRAVIEYIEFQETGKFTSKAFEKMRDVVMNGYIKPCPYCGGDEIDFSTSDELDVTPNDMGMITLVCNFHKGGCGAMSGFESSKELALKQWNSREYK